MKNVELGIKKAQELHCSLCSPTDDDDGTGTHTQRQARVAGTISEKENEKNVLDQNVNGKEVNRVIYF